jgi:hypothetical protein
MFVVNSCDDFLNVSPKQVLDESLLNTPEDMEGFVTAAYARMTDIPSWDSPFSPWWSGSLRSDDSYKGGGGTWDGGDGWGYMETFVNLTPNGWPLDYPWYVSYQIIQRCNTALQKMQDISEEDFPQKNIRIGEMMFIRSFVHFRLKQFFKYMPYIDETVVGSTPEFEAIPNRDKNNPDDQYLWQRILNDFKVAEDLLPLDHTDDSGKTIDRGRVTKNAATAMVARTLMFMAYEQDDAHQVVNINKERLNEALIYLNKLTSQETGKVDLEPDFGYNFVAESDNNTKESIWEIQYSIDDGSSSGGKINRGEGLNHPWAWGGFQCCGFHHVSYSMVNAFRTDANGLPMFDTYNNTNIVINPTNIGDRTSLTAFLNGNTFDPRLSHTAAYPGSPWKYDPNLLYDESGIRNIVEYGYFKSVKELPHPGCGCLMYDGWQFNSMNKRMIRYDEILLWKAEVLIQLDRHDEALPLINKIRTRAANSTDKLVMADDSPVLKYKCETYKPDTNCTWSKEFAWQALQWENRLEMACEGRRFFDLMRWGILEKTMNDYFAVEKNRFTWMMNARFTAGRDEFFPIPQPQIKWAKGNYTQNRGY